MLAVPGVAAVVVFEGVNDLAWRHLKPDLADGEGREARPATAADLIAADRQLITRAHGRGIRIYGATIVPYEGAGYYSAEGEAGRQAVNTWIRTGGAFDGGVRFRRRLARPGTAVEDCAAL